jgi:alkanesulfonate monooxygenase SsuD/methylene tetrahydromethanopterin reductase-like flavin-dependent oxidoreductase (luciferase family)
MRKIFGRKAPVQHEGREISLPYTGPGSAGLAKPLTSILHMRPDIPIWLGTGGESTVKLTAEIADGWLPLGFTPARMKAFRPWLDEGLRRAGGGKTLRDLEIQPRAFVVLTDDVREGLQTLKPRVALYVGGMGHREKNFHTQAMTANGYGEAAERIQELYLAGRKAEAVAAVPDDFIDEGALVGPRDRIRERFRAWADSGATGLTVATQQDEAIELMADLAGCR